jgi:hypothetical protein
LISFAECGSLSAASEHSALETELLGPQSESSPQDVLRRLLKICSQLEEERDAAEEALKKGNVNTSTV